MQRADVGVKTHAHILNVKDHYIQILIYLGRFLFLPYKETIGIPVFHIAFVCNVLSGFFVSPKTVLRAKNLTTSILLDNEKIEKMLIANRGGLIDHQSYFLPHQQRMI